MGRSPSQAGKYACSAGKEAERAVVRALQARGFPDAARVEATGARNGTKVTPDSGDVLSAGLTFQVKRTKERIPSDTEIVDWLFETEYQRLTAGNDYGILVVRRHGKADAGHWWAYMHAAAFTRLVGSRAEHGADYPVRIRLDDLCTTLLDDGYGDEESVA